MKIKIIILYLITISFAGCGDFLKESSLDEVRPSNTDELQQLLMGEGYPRIRIFDDYLEILTDDVRNYPNVDPQRIQILLNGEMPFSWAEDMFEQFEEYKLTENHGVRSWERYYSMIKGCNVIIDYLDKVKGTVVAKNNIKGQALALRGFYYLQLVNLFGMPIKCNGVDHSQSLGVPLKLNMAVADDLLPRNSVGEVYAQIENDMLEAADLLSKNRGVENSYMITDLFANAILSRIYLYMEQWDKSIEYADKVLKVKPALYNLSDRRTAASVNRLESVYSVPQSLEVIWTYGSGGISFFSTSNNIKKNPPYGVSMELEELYEKGDGTNDYFGDLRTKLFYAQTSVVEDGSSPLTRSQKNGNASYCHYGVRSAEMYLNRAESNARKYMVTGDASQRQSALDNLNRLREARYDNTKRNYQPVETRTDGYCDVSTPESLYKFCQEERRRELSFERHRWFDLRRYGMPQIVHTVYGASQNDIVLEAKSKRYVLPIPKRVLERNHNLQPNL